MLQKGVTVSRTGDDLVRYHGKMMIVDREELHVYGFNYTAVDLKSRSFGLVTRDRKMVTGGAAPVRSRRRPPGVRARCSTASSSARRTRASSSPRSSSATKKSLAIYDPKLTDTQMLRLLHQKAKAGVDIRVIGKVGQARRQPPRPEDAGLRLHVRAMIRDGDTVFVGSQSLRGARAGRAARGRPDRQGSEGREADAGGLRGGLGEDRPRQEGTEAVQKELKQAESEEIVLEIPHT